MTKRKNKHKKLAGEAEKGVLSTATKDAATKAIFMQNASYSPLLRMPTEVRNNIWALVLGDRHIHLRYYPYMGTWSNWVCDCNVSDKATAEEPDCKAPTCEEPDHEPDSEGSDCEESDYELETMHLKALRVCRQIYNEANHVLWSTNRFSFGPFGIDTFRLFVNSRTTCQKQLMRKLRLEMELCVEGGCVEDWSRVLGLTHIRSLVGLRSLRLLIEHPLGCEDYQEVKVHGLMSLSFYLEIAQNMKGLHLAEVDVCVDDASDQHPPWTKENRLEYAEAIRRMLLDPEGAEEYALNWRSGKTFIDNPEET